MRYAQRGFGTWEIRVHQCAEHHALAVRYQRISGVLAIKPRWEAGALRDLRYESCSPVDSGGPLRSSARGRCQQVVLQGRHASRPVAAVYGHREHLRPRRQSDLGP